MASITKELRVDAPVQQVWDAVRDVGNIHTRLVPGFVTNCRMEGDDVRVVTFGNGMTVRELIVDLDDVKRRLVWSARGGRLTHHSAALQIFPDGDGTRLVWTADLLPNEMRGAIEGMLEQGMQAMGRALGG